MFYQIIFYHFPVFPLECPFGVRHGAETAIGRVRWLRRHVAGGGDAAVAARSQALPKAAAGNEAKSGAEGQ